MKRYIFLLLFVFLNLNRFYAQSYVGHNIDIYNGIHGVIVNPASVVNPNMKIDINLISASGFAGSDYLRLDKDELLDYSDSLKLNYRNKNFSKNGNNFFGNADILGPSIMYNLSPVHSVAIVTRIRTFFNLNNLNGNLAEDLVEGFETKQNFNFDTKDFNGTFHLWGEIGVTYGRVLINKEQHQLQGGLSLKYLVGGGSIFGSAPRISGRFNYSNQTLETSDALNYGSTPGFNSDYISLDNSASGFGADIGFTYQIKHKKEETKDSVSENSYKIKLGLSVTDLGRASYKNSTITNYNTNRTVGITNFENKSIEEILEANYTGKKDTLKVKVDLPTAMHFLVDYNIRKKFYFSIHGSFSLNSKNSNFTNRIINTVVATPRFESKLFSFYLPLSIRQYGTLSAGTGFRLGPLSLGSGSIITNLFSDRTKTTDVYLGLKIPLYKGWKLFKKNKNS